MRAGSREAVALWRSLCHTGLAARMLSSELEMYPMIAVAPEMAMVRTAGSISAGFVLLSALETHFPVSETPRPLTSSLLGEEPSHLWPTFPSDPLGFSQIPGHCATQCRVVVIPDMAA